MYLRFTIISGKHKQWQNHKSCSGYAGICMVWNRVIDFTVMTKKFAAFLETVNIP